MPRAVRPLAFYLPAYHPIPENDKQWGPGFTEWHNVTQGKPRFRGHYQPHVPADLGFYDLRLPETRHQQAHLARQYSIYGFVYYHYWFSGRRLFDRPFQEVLDSREPDLPFALCWANEPWTRRWDGGNSEVFVEQHYSDKDDREHLENLLPAFFDERYITVDGKPLFLIYRASLLPTVKRTLMTWREMARLAGLTGLYLCCVEAGGEPRSDPRASGFDASVEFQPNFAEFCQPRTRMQRVRRHLEWRLHYNLKLRSEDYADYVRRCLQATCPAYPRHPGVCTAWDNSARARGTALTFVNSSPDIFKQWIIHTLERSHLRADRDLLFINAWNEWGEGCHLEPDRAYGHAWLEAVRDALKEVK